MSGWRVLLLATIICVQYRWIVTRVNPPQLVFSLMLCQLQGPPLSLPNCVCISFVRFPWIEYLNFSILRTIVQRPLCRSYCNTRDVQQFWTDWWQNKLEFSVSPEFILITQIMFIRFELTTASTAIKSPDNAYQMDTRFYQIAIFYLVPFFCLSLNFSSKIVNVTTINNNWDKTTTFHSEYWRILFNFFWRNRNSFVCCFYSWFGIWLWWII